MFIRFLLAAALFLTPLGAQAQNFDAIATDRPADTATGTSGAGPDKGADKAANAAGGAATAPASSAAGGDQCGDDPRLANEMFAIMQSDAPITPPITVTPETYLILEPEVVARLNGQMVICPNIPVLRNGKTVKKVPVNFDAVWNALSRAAVTRNEDRVKQLLATFTARPMNTAEILKLFATIGLDQKARELLYRAAGLPVPSDDDAVFIDFYRALGGKAADKKMVLINQFAAEASSELDAVAEEYQRKKDDIYLIHGVSRFNSPTAWYKEKLIPLGIHAVRSQDLRP